MKNKRLLMQSFFYLMKHVYRYGKRFDIIKSIARSTMKPQSIHTRTRKFVFKNIAVLLLILIVMSLIETGINVLSGEWAQTMRLIETLISNPNINADDLANLYSGDVDYLTRIFGNVISRYVHSIVLIAIVDALRNQGKLTLSNLIDRIKNKPFTILLGCLMLSLIDFILQMIPGIGVILALVFEYASYFVLILLHDSNDIEPLDALLISLKLSKGHKLPMFMLQVLYGITFILVLFFVGVASIVINMNIVLFFVILMGINALYTIFSLTISSVYYSLYIDPKRGLI